MMFQENCEMKRIMAVRNISAYEARKEMSNRKPKYYEEKGTEELTTSEEGAEETWEEVIPKIARRESYAEKVYNSKKVRKETIKHKPREKKNQENTGCEKIRK